VSTRTRSVFDDRELVQLLRDEPELLAIADALVVTLGPSYATTRRAATLQRRAKRLAPLAVAVAALVALLLVAPWQRSPSLVDNALAAIGNGHVLHVVVERAQPDESLRDLATGRVLPRPVRTEIWFDGSRDLKKTISSLGGRVLDDMLETKDGGWSQGGPIYTCAWIAAHPVETTKAGVSCNRSGDNGTTPRTVPEQPPAVDLGLAGFVDRYRSALASGEATRVGQGTFDGRDVVWLRIETENGPERVAIDASTHEPVLIEPENAGWRLHVLGAETLPFDAATFARPVVVPAQLGGGVSSEAPIDIGQASDALGAPVLWLGREWSGLRLVSVTRQERTIHTTESSSPSVVPTVKLEYARVGADGTVEERPALQVYETTSCLVRVGWTCSARDPVAPTVVGQPMGDLFALLRRGEVYVSIWRSPDPATPSLLDATRAVRPVGS